MYGTVEGCTAASVSLSGHVLVCDTPVTSGYFCRLRTSSV